MNVCRVCGGPMVWTEFHNRQWCAVYGDHKACEPKWRTIVNKRGDVYEQDLAAPNARLVALVMAADEDDRRKVK